MRGTMNYTYCIWDFNGTILDDVELGIYALNVLLKESGIEKTVTKEEYIKLFGFPIIDYYREVGFDFEKTPYSRLAEDWIKIYLENLDKAKLFFDVVTTLEFFKARGIKQSVLSASEKDILNMQIDMLDIRAHFEEIMGIDNIYGDSKLSLARDWRKRHPNERVIFIGDTLHDIETAEALLADCYIVSAGHQSRERFEGRGVKVFSSLTELCETLDN